MYGIEQAETGLNSKKNFVKKWVIIVVVAFVFVMTGLCFAVYNSTPNRLSRQLNLGQKYLDELNYEQAIAAFDKAIQIDPMSIEAYLGMAGAYKEMGNLDNALAALDAGYIAVEKSNESQEEIIDYYIALAEEQIENREYEIGLKVYDRLLELNTKEQKIFKSLGKCLNEYLDLLMEQENYDEVKKLAERYSAIVPDVDFSLRLETIEEALIIQKLKSDWLEEIKKYTRMCDNQTTQGYLSNEYLNGRCKPWVDKLEKYKDVWIEDQKCIGTYGTFLYVYYWYFDLEKCIAIRKAVYDECIEKGYEFSFNFIPEESMVDTNDSGIKTVHDMYGRQVRTYGITDGTMWPNSEGMQVDETFEYGENGRASKGTDIFIDTDGRTQNDAWVMQYDSDGRKINRVHISTVGFEGESDGGSYTKITTTYEYTDQGFIQHDSTESYSSYDKQTIITTEDMDCTLDEFGNVTYGEKYNTQSYTR